MEAVKRSKKTLSGVIKVRIKGEAVFWAGGLMELLEYIKRCQSLKQACEQMQMSYSKGHRIVKIAEKELGFAIIRSEKGGSHGGGSVLTREGERFAKCYKAFEEDVEAYGAIIFKSYFDEFL